MTFISITFEAPGIINDLQLEVRNISKMHTDSQLAFEQFRGYYNGLQ